MGKVSVKTGRLMDGTTVTGTIQEWASRYGVAYQAMWDRWSRGCAIDFSGSGWARPRTAKRYPFRVSTSDKIIYKTVREASMFPGWHKRSATAVRRASKEGYFMDLPPPMGRRRTRTAKAKPVPTGTIGKWVTRPANAYIDKVLQEASIARLETFC